MERLTKSQHVVNVHGYCGQSALNEIINPVSLNSANLSSKRKLIFARDAAEALADVHTIDNGNVTLIHRDVAGANFVLSRDGKSLMINDFNTARLQYWNVAESKPCGFKRQDCNDVRLLDMSIFPLLLLSTIPYDSHLHVCFLFSHHSIDHQKNVEVQGYLKRLMSMH